VNLLDEPQTPDMVERIARLHYASGQFAMFQRALVSLASHPRPNDEKYLLGVLMFWGRRQNALEYLILELDELSEVLTIPENRDRIDTVLVRLCETWEVAEDATVTATSLS